MRLAQIARKLNIKSTEVVTFIEQNFQVEIPNTPNTKIPDEYIDEILQQFAPKIIERVHTEEIISSENLNLQEQNNEIEEITSEFIEDRLKDEDKLQTENIIPGKDLDKSSIQSPEEKPSEEAIELHLKDGVIKAPKIEIEGVKVVGKIELPSDKVVQKRGDSDFHEDDVLIAEDQNSEVLATQKETSQTKSEKPKTKKPQQKPKKTNSLSYEEEISKSQQAYKEELRKKRAIEKEKRTKNYELLMQKQAPRKPKKKSKRKAIIENTEVQIQQKKEEAPKSLWKKFIYWLNH